MAAKRGKGGGFFDGFFKNPFGINGWLGYKVFKEVTKGDDEENDVVYDPEGDSDEYAWRLSCLDGLDYGVNPYDYETIEEFIEALHKAKYAWRKTVEVDYDVDIDPDDYETEEEYEEAFHEAKYGWRENVDAENALILDPEDYETEEEYEEAVEEEKYGWRETVETDSSLDVDPEDYETEDEYMEALEEAREAITCLEEDTDDTEEEVKESDFPNKRRYRAAVMLADEDTYFYDEELQRGRCNFILKQGDSVIAANYLTEEGQFLFAQAIKDNFDLPITLPDEDEKREISLCDILKKISRKDVPLALNVWEWCIKQFLPYLGYAPDEREELIDSPLDDLDRIGKRFSVDFRSYLKEHTDFRTKIIREAAEMPDCLPGLIVNSIKDGNTDTAEELFSEGLRRTDGKWKQVNQLVQEVIEWAQDDDEELETIEFVESHFLPIVKKYPDGMIQDEVEAWEENIAEYKHRVERESEKYAYSRCNAWRKTVPDGKKYYLDPLDYDTEQEYLDALREALQEEKYGWREWCRSGEEYGLDPNQFETKEEYDEAWQACRDAEQQKKYEERLRRQELAREKKRKEAEEKKQKRANSILKLTQGLETYIYCGVMLSFAETPFYFRTNDTSLKIGDRVIVPIGQDDRETEGIIASIGQYAEVATPYPVENTKFIIRKADDF